MPCPYSDEPTIVEQPVEIPDTVPAEWVEEQAPDRELVPA